LFHGKHPAILGVALAELVAAHIDRLSGDEQRAVLQAECLSADEADSSFLREASERALDEFRLPRHRKPGNSDTGNARPSYALGRHWNSQSVES
jgi:hypothetical protein